MHSLEYIPKIEDPNAALVVNCPGKDLACVCILYLKVILRIFIYKMHSAKKLRCLVRILENAKCILGRNSFCKFSFLEQKSESKIFWILILASTFNFC